MRTHEEWHRELAALDIQCCGFWHLDEKGKEIMLKFWKKLKEKDDEKGEKINEK